ncbi:MAG: sodium transporter, partial [Maricaulis sp.]|nr:sodium transporter [Maricaulis sp.]
TPGIVALFVLGVFWKSATANGALAAAIGSFGLSVLGKLYLDWMPFLDRVGWIFLACLGIMFAMAMIERKDQGEKAVSIDGVSFSTSSLYNLGALVVVVTLGLLYWAFW